MTNKEQIAEILRDTIRYSGQAGDYIIHGAIEKIQAREKTAHAKGIYKGILIGLFIALVLILIVIKTAPMVPAFNPEEQLNDTIRAGEGRIPDSTIRISAALDSLSMGRYLVNVTLKIQNTK